jgi:hypothetical protein
VQFNHKKVAMKHFALAALMSTALLAHSGQADATTYTFVGSWEVDDGPGWWTQPIAYSGQEAAALLFGGVASDYVISTIDNLATNINFLAWYSILGVVGGHALAHDLDQDLPGELYYDGGTYTFGDLTNPASSYVWDNAQGSAYTNYVFRVAAVPLPAAGFMLIGALGGLALLRRRKAV